MRANAGLCGRGDHPTDRPSDGHRLHASWLDTSVPRQRTNPGCSTRALTKTCCDIFPRELPSDLRGALLIVPPEGWLKPPTKTPERNAMRTRAKLLLGFLAFCLVASLGAAEAQDIKP